MRYTHEINFFSNKQKVLVQGDVVVAVEPNGFAACCAGCGELMEGYWLLIGNQIMCPSENCASWPVVKLK